MTVFNANKTKQQSLFFGPAVGIARFDVQAFPFLEKLTEKQLGFFWLPTEVDVARDAKDFKALSSHEQHIFTANLKRQIVLDSVQGRAPSMAFLPIASCPEFENWIQTWSFFETIHSRSYTHLIRNVYPDPSKVFDEILDIPEILLCAEDISRDYDNLIRLAADPFLPSNKVTQTGSNLFLKKEALWRCLMAVNILEGIRFYVSFACSWAFAETKRMEGNAKIIKFIARDENVHLAATQQILKTLVKTDKQFAEIAEASVENSRNMFISAAEQEKKWADYLFKDGSIIGLNKQLLSEYIDWIANRRMLNVGLPGTDAPRSNPLPWTQKWITGGDVQPAPQETEISSYLTGGMKKDVTANSFSGLKL